MKTFKNKNFKKRDYDCTNVVFVQSENAPNENWVECDETEIETLKCDQLYKQGNERYFGYM